MVAPCKPPSRPDASLLFPYNSLQHERMQIDLTKPLLELDFSFPLFVFIFLREKILNKMINCTVNAALLSGTIIHNFSPKGPCVRSRQKIIKMVGAMWFPFKSDEFGTEQ